MSSAPSTAFPPTRSVGDALLNRNRFRFLGLTPDDIIKYFFNGNAVVAVVVLALITIFLFREGAGFFGQNLRNLRLYRLAGLEYVDFIRHEVDGYCTHHHRAGGGCGIYANRPGVCRRYSCANDSRIWKDFDQMELNTEWIAANLPPEAEERRVGTLM